MATPEKWWEGAVKVWTQADQIHQDNLDLAKEEAAERKLAERALNSITDGSDYLVSPVQLQLVQLLRDKEEQIAGQAVYIRELHAFKNRLVQLVQSAESERRKAQSTGQIARYGLAMAVELARKLVEITSSRSEHEACKAILQAWEELKIHDQQGQAAADPNVVGHAALRHVADCQDERPAGVRGGEHPGTAERAPDRAASEQEVFYDLNEDCRYRRRYIRYRGAVPAHVMLWQEEDGRLYWRDYLPNYLPDGE